MPSLLLIASENGRPLKTYGVNQVKFYNMKFTFICIIAIISCSVCASGDLEIYPGLKYNLDREERRARLENYDTSNFYPDYKRYWKNAPVEDYGEIDRKDLYFYPELIRQLERTEYAESQSRHRNHQPHYESPRHHYEFEEVYKQLKDAHKPNLDNYDSGIPNAQILDDVRMYPQEDDFTFKSEDGEEQDDNIYGQPSLEQQESLMDKIDMSDDDASEDDMHHEHREAKLTNEEQFPSGQYKHVKVADDPTEFAYPPSDPRFFEKADSAKTLDADSREEKTEKLSDINTSENPFKINTRSDQYLRHDGRVDSLNFKSANGELTSRTGVDVVAMKPSIAQDTNSAGVYIIAIVAGISAAATVGLIAVAIGWYNLQKHVKNASDVEYPAYGVTGPNKDISPSGDRRLAQSAQMYHYQHQKQQIIAMERAPPSDRHGSVSDADSDEENEEGDYTVYECPGLAPTGEMEVKNPLFQDDPTPAQTPAIKANEENK